MSYAKQLLDATKGGVFVDSSVLARTIEALDDCAQACAADADADLSEPNVAEMVHCIRLCVECTDICTATGRVISRPSEYEPDVTSHLLEACIAICKACGDECEHHAQMHEHCRVCAEACRRCEHACRDLLAALA